MMSKGHEPKFLNSQVITISNNYTHQLQLVLNVGGASIIFIISTNSHFNNMKN